MKVLDLSRILAGPWASQLLGDYGAEVIKVERPGCGDDTRRWGPPWVGDSNGAEGGDAAYFHVANRNKKSITINIADESGRAIVRDLATRCDVFLENYKAGDLKRYGLDAQALHQINPRLIYCTISAYGSDSSRAHLPGYDAMIQASAGLMSITGDAEGGQPQKVGVAISDIMAGMYAVTAILAALHAREESGIGQHIEVPLYDSQVAWLANQGMNYLVSGKVPGRLGSAHPNIVPYQMFEASDGFVMVAIGNDAQFRNLAACLAIPHVSTDSRFRTNPDRVKYRHELISILEPEFGKRPVDDWISIFGQNNIPCGRVNSIDTVMEDDYAQERTLVHRVPHTFAGETPTVANPVRFSANEITYRHGAPTLGEHTRDILINELGYAPDAVERLAKDGVI